MVVITYALPYLCADGLLTLDDLVDPDFSCKLSTRLAGIEAEAGYQCQIILLISSFQLPVATVAFLPFLIQPSSIVQAHCVASLGFIYAVSGLDDHFREFLNHDGVRGELARGCER